MPFTFPKLTALMAACAGALTACSSTPVRMVPVHSVSMDIRSDGCNLAPIVRDHWASGKWATARTTAVDYFARDRNARLRFSYRARDTVLLRDIVDDERFEFVPDCTSSFTAEFKIRERSLLNSRDYNFRTSSRSKLCQATPFSYGVRGLKTGEDSLPPEYIDEGVALTCIDIRWGNVDFIVQRPGDPR